MREKIYSAICLVVCFVFLMGISVQADKKNLNESQSHSAQPEAESEDYIVQKFTTQYYQYYIDKDSIFDNNAHEFSPK